MGFFFGRNKKKAGVPPVTKAQKSQEPRAAEPVEPMTVEPEEDWFSLFLEGVHFSLGTQGELDPKKAEDCYRRCGKQLQEDEDEESERQWFRAFQEAYRLPGNHAGKDLSLREKQYRRLGLAACASVLSGFDDRSNPFDSQIMDTDLWEVALGYVPEETPRIAAHRKLLMSLLTGKGTEKEEIGDPDCGDFRDLLKGWLDGDEEALIRSMEAGSTAGLWKLCLQVKREKEGAIRFWPQIRDRFLTSESAFETLDQRVWFAVQCLPEYAVAICDRLAKVYGEEEVTACRNRLRIFFVRIKENRPLPEGVAAPAVTEMASKAPEPWRDLLLEGLRLELGMEEAPDRSGAFAKYAEARRAVGSAPEHEQKWMETFFVYYELPGNHAMLPLSERAKSLREIGLAVFAGYQSDRYEEVMKTPAVRLMTAGEWADFFRKVPADSETMEVSREALVELLELEDAPRPARILRNYDRVLQDVHEDFRRDADRAQEEAFDRSLLVHDYRFLLRGMLLLGSSASLLDTEYFMDRCEGRHPLLVGCDYLEKAMNYGSTAACQELLSRLSWNEEARELLRQDRWLRPGDNVTEKLFWPKVKEMYLPSETAFEGLSQKIRFGEICLKEQIGPFFEEMIRRYGYDAVQQKDPLGFLGERSSYGR